MSDFGRGDWGHSFKLIPPDVSLHLLSTSGPQRRNVGITNVKTSLLPQGRRRVMATLRNYAPVAESRTITVTVGSARSTQNIRMDALAQQKVSFSINDAPEKATGIVALDNDDYTEDDSFQFSLKTAGAPKALIIAEDDNELKGRLSALFTAKAMTSGDQTGVDAFQITASSPIMLEQQTVQEARAIFILGCLDKISPDDLSLIREATKQGTALFITPGSDNSTATIRCLQDSALMSVQCNGVVEASHGTSLGIGWVDADSPIGRLCADWTETDLFLFPIVRHLRLQPLPPAHAVMKSLTDFPLLIEQDCGIGKCHLFAFDFSTEWSAFPLTSSFLPILRELCRSSIPDDYGTKTITCGASITSEDGTAIDTSFPHVAFDNNTSIIIASPISEAMTESINPEDLELSLRTEQKQSLNTGDEQKSIPLWKYAALLLALTLLLEALARCLTDRSQHA